MSTYLPYIVIPFVITMLFVLWDQLAGQISTYQPIPQERPLIFKVAGWMYGVLLLVALLFSCFVIEALIRDSPIKWFQISLGMFFVLISLFECWRLSKARVEITKDAIIYVKLRKKEIVRLDQIKRVFTANGNIIIDTGIIPRTAIPMYFKDSSIIAYVLRTSIRWEHYLGNNKSSLT